MSYIGTLSEILNGDLYELYLRTSDVLLDGELYFGTTGELLADELYFRTTCELLGDGCILGLLVNF